MELDKIIKLIDMVDTVVFNNINDIILNNEFDCKSLFSKYLNKILKLTKSDSDILKIRLNIENSLNKYTYQQLIEKIYFNFKDINIDYDQFYNLCRNLEVSIYTKNTHIKSNIIELFNYCKKHNKKVLCIFDTYLSKDMLLEIFRYHGLDKYIYDVILSNEYAEDNLYKTILKKYHLKLSECLIIGDKPECNIKTISINKETIDRKFEKGKFGIISNSDIKEFNEITKNKNFKNEYNIYKFIDKLFFEMISKNYFSFNIKNELIKQRFNEYKREIILDYNNNNKVITIDYNNNIRKIVAQSEDINMEQSCNLNNLDINVFRDIVRILQNNINEDEITKSLELIKETNLLNEPSDKTKKKLKSLGKKYSPLFYKFVLWILNDCQKNGISKIYFFTREGEFFYQVANKISGFDNISKSILEVSRLSTFCPSIRKVNIDEMMRIWNQYYIQSMSTFCKTLGLNVDDFITLFEKYNLSLNENILFPYNDYRVKKLFKDQEFVSILQKNIDMKKNNILDYFKSKGLDNSKERIAIVDIGWRGTIQDNVCYLLPNKEIYGYYFGLYDYFNIQPKNSQKFGFLNQYENGIKFLDNVTPIEMLCNSPFGSTVEYKFSKAIRKIDKQENESYDKCIKFIQEGIFENIQNLENKNISNNELLKILNNLIFTPNIELSKTYFKLKHNAEFGLGKYINTDSKINYSDLFLSPLSKKHRNKIKESIMNSTWNQGYLKVNHLGILNYYYKQKKL